MPFEANDVAVFGRGIQRPVADRIIFQGDKTKFKNKTVLWEPAEYGADPNMDSIDSVSALLFVKDTIEERGAFIYQFHNEGSAL
jgi:hypothetical protein